MTEPSIAVSELPETMMFEAGKTYVQNEPYRAPEHLTVFRCTAVADGLAEGEVTRSWPGTEWKAPAHEITVLQPAGTWLEAEYVHVESERESSWQPIDPTWGGSAPWKAGLR